MPTLEVSNIETTQDATNNDESDPNDSLIDLPLDNNTLSELQQKDMFCANILAQIEKGNIIEGLLYKVQNKLLKRYVTNGEKTYETIVMPRALTAQILKMAHDNLGHNGTHRTYVLLKRLYYWKGLKPSVTKHGDVINVKEEISKWLNTLLCILMWLPFQCSLSLWI